MICTKYRNRISGKICCAPSQPKSPQNHRILRRFLWFSDLFSRVYFCDFLLTQTVTHTGKCPETTGERRRGVSSDPNVVRVENVLGHWTANAQAPGTATITVTAPDGRTGSVTITVQSAIPSSPAGESTAALTDNMAIRLELVRLINQTRVANGAAELPVSEALMNAAQACSNQR